MKLAIILIVATLAFAAQARLNASELAHGFMKKANLSRNTAIELANCSFELSRKSYSISNSSKNFVPQLMHFIMETDAEHKKDLEAIHKDVAMALHFPECAKSAKSLVEHFSGKLEPFEAHLTVKERVTRNFYRYGDAWVSQITKLVDEIVAEQSVQVGESVAALLEMVFGKVKPHGIIDWLHEFRSSDEVPVHEPVAFLHKALNTVVKSLGGSYEISVEDVKALGKNLEAAVAFYNKYKMDLSNAKTQVEKELVTVNYIRDSTKAGAAYSQVVQKILAPFAANLNLKKVSPARAAVHVIHNILLHFNQVFPEELNLEFALHMRQPETAGKHLAEIIKIMTK